MPKYILRSTESIDAITRVPDMRGFGKDNVRAMADNLCRIWGLPEAVATRALIRASDVSTSGGDVFIDDDAVVLYPVMTFRRELIPHTV